MTAKVEARHRECGVCGEADCDDLGHRQECCGYPCAYHGARDDGRERARTLAEVAEWLNRGAYPRSRFDYEETTQDMLDTLAHSIREDTWRDETTQTEAGDGG